MKYAQKLLEQAAQECRVARSKQMLVWICQHGYALNELVLIQYFSRPVFHITNEPWGVTSEDSFLVLPLAHVKEEIGHWPLNLKQRDSGLWVAWEPLPEQEAL